MKISIHQKLTIPLKNLLHHFQFLHQNPIFTLTKPFSSSSSTTITNNVVTYLVNSCGVPPNKAKILSNKHTFKNIEKSNSLIAFLKENGFTTTHIGKIVSWDPRWLKCRYPEKTLIPKFEFLYSIGVSKDCIGDIICGCTTFLTRSLDRVLKPGYDRLRRAGFSDKHVVMLLKRRPWLLLGGNGVGDNNLDVNVRFLREIGVPQSKIVYLISLRADVVFVDHAELCKCVNEVVELGFDVKKTAFLWALCANYNDRNKEILERSFMAYGKWGLSRDDCLEAYRKYPQSMFLSEQNIMTKMDFFVNKVGIEARVVAKCLLVLCYSLEKRIFPRFSVLCVLERKGLMKKNPSLSKLLSMSEKLFVETYIEKYVEDVPELASVYQGKINPFESGNSCVQSLF